jgi:hypothetical protein
MKTSQPRQVQEATKAIRKAISATKDEKYEKSFEIYSPPLDRHHMGKDLALVIFGGTSLDRRRNGFLYDIITNDGVKLLVSTSPLYYSKSNSSHFAHCSAVLFPAAYLEEERIPDFVILVVFNHLSKTTDVFRFPIRNEEGLIRNTVSAYYSVKTQSYGKNQKYLVRSIPA